MHAASDIFLGWLHVAHDFDDGRPRDFYLRQLWDFHGWSLLTSVLTQRGWSSPIHVAPAMPHSPPPGLRTCPDPAS